MSSLIPGTTSGGNLARGILIAVAIMAAFGFGLLLSGDGESRPGNEIQAEHGHAAGTIWTCSMHPAIKLPEPGQCPICFMDLIPLETGHDDDLGPRVLVLSESAAALAEIQTMTVERRRAEARVRLIGKVDFDETLFRVIAAWVPGRIDDLFVDYTGTVVQRGERLASLYSPELYAAQTELLSAIQAGAEIQKSSDSLMRETALATVTAARERLRLWGLDESRIARIEQTGKARHHVDITAPLSGVVIHKEAVEGMYVKTGTTLYTVADLSRVWVTLAAYESDLIWLKTGQEIAFTVDALPAHRFEGVITFIDPVLNSRTRTTMVRLIVDNGQGLLKPGMFVKATVAAEVVAEAGSAGNATAADLPLVIPATAPLITGKRAVVYIRVPGSIKPTFEGREVVLGPRVGDSYIVASGLAAGEVVVTRGNFKIDSALQIQAKPSMMNPAGTGAVSIPVASGDTFATPEEFRVRLDTVLESYLVIQTALAKDDPEGAGAAARQARDALQSVDATLVSGEAHLAWSRNEKQLRESLAAISGAADIEAQRRHLQGLTDQIWNALRVFGHRQAGPVRLFNCPMAAGGTGGDWIQLDETTANPYFGAAMLLCGGQTDSLAVSEPRKDG